MLELTSTTICQHTSNLKAFIHESSCVYNLQQNEVAETKNRHLLNVPEPYYFKEVFLSPIGVTLYRLPAQVLEYKSPIEILNSFYPHFRTFCGLTLKVFGCLLLFTSITNKEAK